MPVGAGDSAKVSHTSPEADVAARAEDCDRQKDEILSDGHTCFFLGVPNKPRRWAHWGDYALTDSGVLDSTPAPVPAVGG